MKGATGSQQFRKKIKSGANLPEELDRIVSGPLLSESLKKLRHEHLQKQPFYLNGEKKTKFAKKRADEEHEKRFSEYFPRKKDHKEDNPESDTMETDENTTGSKSPKKGIRGERLRRGQKRPDRHNENTAQHNNNPEENSLNFSNSGSGSPDKGEGRKRKKSNQAGNSAESDEVSKTSRGSISEGEGDALLQPLRTRVGAESMMNETHSIRGRQRVPWTHKEEEKLYLGVQKYKIGNWRKIWSFCNFGNKRTNVHIKDKWRQMIKDGSTEQLKQMFGPYE